MSGQPRLVFVTQVLDPSDSVLGPIAGSVRALAARAEVTVIAIRARNVPPDLGADVVSLGGEYDASRVVRAARFQRALQHVFRAVRPHALLAHMCPIYVIAAAPLARTYGVRSMLWFAHWRDSSTLALAERLSDCVLTSLPNAYPRTTSKCRAIGQATAIDRFAVVPPAIRNNELRLIAIGRMTRAKRFPSMIEAVVAARDCGLPARLRIVGPATTGEEAMHQRELQDLVHGLDAHDVVTVEAAVRHDDVPSLLAGSDALLNGAMAGTADKAVFEAMAAARPVIWSNPTFEPLFAGIAEDLRFGVDDAKDLARVISAFAGYNESRRRQLGARLRQRVGEQHSVGHWADEVVRAATGDRP
jgi:glycosyltransferase involved in cell wall biosynthesis